MAVPTSPQYRIITTAHFDRLLKNLVAKHPDLVARFEEMIEILCADPYNKTRRSPIEKLEGVPPGDGQYRFRSGRFRYDIERFDVVLMHCGLRRENTY